MNFIRAHIVRYVAPVAAACVVAAFAFSHAGARGPDAGAQEPEPPQQRSLVQLMFPDAPDGVDPVVTGPTSAEFRERQRSEGCDSAVWPNIPPSCYPR